MRIRVLAAVMAAFALTPAAASAIDRFASPTGTGSLCTQAQPCDIVTAVNDPVSGDITIGPGTYGPISTNLTDSGAYQLTIHGEAGQPRPVIETTATYGFNLTDASSTLSDVQVDDTADDTTGVLLGGGSADHVFVEDSGSGALACSPDGKLIDSVCWASGTNVVGVSESDPNAVGTLRNDTVIASGAGGIAIDLNAAGGTPLQINMTNTIANGAATDIAASTVNPGSEVIVDADHSNYLTVNNDAPATVTITAPGTGTDQTTAPAFADAITGNFHELAGSATIGAGADSALNGTTDLDGNPREIENTTDIGAYEFVPKPTCTPRSIGTKFQTGVTIQLECRDPVGAVLTYALASKPAHGTVSTPNTAGVVLYKPATAFTGTDRFTYAATSSNGTAIAATILVVVGKEPAPKLSSVKLSKSTVDFTLNEAASITLTFARRGHRSVSAKLKGKAGKNSYKIKKLKAGKYTMTIAASNAGGRSKPAKLSFKIA